MKKKIWIAVGVVVWTLLVGFVSYSYGSYEQRYLEVQECHAGDDRGRI